MLLPAASLPLRNPPTALNSPAVASAHATALEQPLGHTLARASPLYIAFACIHFLYPHASHPSTRRTCGTPPHSPWPAYLPFPPHLLLGLLPTTLPPAPRHPALPLSSRVHCSHRTPLFPTQ